MIGGPFAADIEQIIRDRAFLMGSPVLSSCDPGHQELLPNALDRDNGKLYQHCDTSIKFSNDVPLANFITT